MYGKMYYNECEPTNGLTIKCDNIRAVNSCQTNNQYHPICRCRIITRYHQCQINTLCCDLCSITRRCVECHEELCCVSTVHGTPDLHMYAMRYNML
jgi:hypothetical protein